MVGYRHDGDGELVQNDYSIIGILCYSNAIGTKY